jgi:transcription elongation factor Elf1
LRAQWRDTNSQNTRGAKLQQKFKCPYCEKINDAHDAVSDDGAGLIEDIKPTPGDYSMCIECGRFSVVTTHAGSLMLRKLTLKETQRALTDSNCIRLMAAWMHVKDRHRA